jgi:uncharacterized membrane protein YsdA (DUF1294 family)
VIDYSVFSLTGILRWISIIGVVGFGMMGADKGLAILGLERISERTLFLLAFAGGFWGIILGGIFFHHKTSKPGFIAMAIFAGVVWIVGLSVYSLDLLKF